MKLKLLLLISIFLVSGCSLFQPEVVVQTKLTYSKIICPTPPKPVGVTMLKVAPKGVFDENGIVWVGLEPKHYENLALNFQDMVRYIKAQKGQTKYYQDCILDFNVEMDKLQNQGKTK